MYNENFINVKPLTKKMIEFLMDCHERELMQMPPCDATQGGAKGVLIRGLVTPTLFVDEKGKSLMCVRISNKGKEFLRNIM